MSGVQDIMSQTVTPSSVRTGGLRNAGKASVSVGFADGETCDEPVYAENGELALHESLLARDTAALATVVQEHSGRVQTIIHRIIEGFGEWEDVEELAQDVFIKVWLRIDQFDANRGTLEKWINMFAKYIALDFRRKATRRYRSLQSFEEIEEVLVAKEDQFGQSFRRMEREEQLQLLRAALEDLPNEKLDLLVWHYLEGKTYGEAAKLAQIPVGTAKSRIHRALKKLRLFIQNRLEV